MLRKVHKKTDVFPMRKQTTSKSSDFEMDPVVTRKPLSSAVSEFFESTTLHGISYLGKGNVARRFLWGLAILSCFGVCTWQVYASIKLFSSWPISTSITQESKKELTFPAVTICNFNVLNARQSEKTMKRANLTTEQRKAWKEIALQTAIFFSSQGSADIESIIKFLQGKAASAEDMAQNSQPIEDMLSLKWPVPCKFSGQKCGPQNFTTISTERLGKCYTFNSGREWPPLKVKMVGSNHGLRLSLFVDQMSAVKNFVLPQAGFKVLIHHQQEYPFVEELGFAVQPGTHTFCAIRRKKIKSLPSPFKTNCGEKKLRFMTHFNTIYSRPACLRECVFDSIIRRCSCQPFLKIFPDVDLCTVGTLANCVLPSYDELDEETGDCFDTCPEPCISVKYDTTLSYATVLSNAFTGSYPLLWESANKEITTDQIFNTSKDDIVGLDIYYEELSQDHIKQQSAFDLLSLIGNIGGYLGLFLGMSVLTLFEFLDFFATIIQSLRVRPTNAVAETSEP